LSDTSRKILGALTISPDLLETTEELSSALFYGRERIVFESISGMWSESRPSTIDIVLLSEMVGGETPVTYVTNLLKPNEIDCVAKEKFLTLVNELVSRHDSLARDVRIRIEQTTGDFTTAQLYAEFREESVAGKDAIRQIIFRMKEAGEILPVGRKDGVYRKVDKALEEVDLLGTPPTPVDIYLPLGLDQLVKIYPRSIVVIAGAGNRGKTALAYDFIKNNMDKHEIRLLFAEGGAESLIDRLSVHPDKAMTDWKFKAYPRTRHFEDVILPNGITVVDYMLIPDEFWLVGHYLDEIYRKLDKGIVYVNIQKDTKAEIGRGGEFGLERPQLYVTLNPDMDVTDKQENQQYCVAKILKAKAWKRKMNPDGKSLKFSIEDGWCIKHFNDWHYAHKQERQKKVWS
jgi:hypothetical protein